MDFIAIYACCIDNILGFDFLAGCRFDFPAIAAFLNIANIKIELNLCAVLHSNLCHGKAVFPRIYYCGARRIQSTNRLIGKLRLICRKRFLIPNFKAFNSVCTASFIKLLNGFCLLLRESNNKRTDSLIRHIKLFANALCHFGTAHV